MLRLLTVVVVASVACSSPTEELPGEDQVVQALHGVILCAEAHRDELARLGAAYDPPQSNLLLACSNGQDTRRLIADLPLGLGLVRDFSTTVRLMTAAVQDAAATADLGDTEGAVNLLNTEIESLKRLIEGR